MKHYGLLFLLLSASASGASGSWSADDIGPALNLRGMAVFSPPLSPPGAIPAGAQVREVIWRFRLLNPAPLGLQVKLCAPQRCIELTWAHGRSGALSGVPADAPLRFVYLVEGKGTLYPPLRIISNQVIVNYDYVRFHNGL